MILAFLSRGAGFLNNGHTKAQIIKASTQSCFNQARIYEERPREVRAVSKEAPIL
jgi:hypothetical protein